MRRILLSVMVGCWLAAVAGVAAAQDAKPVLTAAFAGYDELFADLEYVGGLVDQPEMAKGLEAMLTMMTGGLGLDGLDKAKPWGAAMYLSGDEPRGFVFLPVKDMKKLLGAAAALGVQAGEPDDGVYEIEVPDQTVFAKQQNGWAIVAMSKDDLALAPSDPLTLVGEMPKKYDFAVRGSVQNVPRELRDLLAQQIRQGAEMGMVPMPDESQEQFAARTAIARKTIEQMVEAINDLDVVLLGVSIDRTARSAYLDVQVTAVAGSKTAAAFGEMVDATTDFAGFGLPGAAMTLQVASKLSDADVAQAKEGIAALRRQSLAELKNQGLPAADEQTAEKVLTDLFDVLDKTIDARKTDGGMIVMLEPDSAALVVGGAVADGAKLEGALKTLIQQIAKEQPELAAGIKLDAETYQGVRFHQVTVPLPDDDDTAVVRQLVGESLEIVIGASDGSAYLSAGRDAAGLLKKVIDASKAEPAKKTPPMRMTIALGPILKTVAAAADDDQIGPMVEMLAGLLEQSTGKDHVNVSVRGIANGSVTRLELEEGILRIIPTLGQMMGAAGPGMPGAEGIELEMQEAIPSPF